MISGSTLANSIAIVGLLLVIWYTIEARWTRKSYEKQFTREWQLDYYFAVQSYDVPSETEKLRYGTRNVSPRQTDAAMIVANLGRPAMLVQGVFVKSNNTTQTDHKIIPFVLAQGQIEQFIIADFLRDHLVHVGMLGSSGPTESLKWSGKLSVSPIVYSQGKKVLPHWQKYVVHINFNAVQAIHPDDG